MQSIKKAHMRLIWSVNWFNPNIFTGAEHACTATKTNLQVAQSKVEEIRKISKDAEKKLAETKAEEIQRMAEYASSIDINDLEDIPEAYLRED